MPSPKILLVASLIALTSKAQAVNCLSGAAGDAVADNAVETNTLINDHSTASSDPARQAKDTISIEKLAKKKGNIAVKWAQNNPTVPK